MNQLPIQAHSLSKTYPVGFTRTRRVNALRGLDLSVEPGTVFGLLGPNGAGKSTTIKILLDLVKPSGGKAELFGRPTSDRQARVDVGYVPENPAPYEYLTGNELVRLCGHLVGLSGHELDKRADQVLQRVGLAVRLELLHQVDRFRAAVGPLLHRVQLSDDDPGEEDREQGQPAPAEDREQRSALFRFSARRHVHVFR